MMTEPKVIAPALAEPSVPFPITRATPAAIDASEQEIACARQRLKDEDLTMIGLRFRGDPLVPTERFETLKREFGIGLRRSRSIQRMLIQRRGDRHMRF